jgi:hypothetical protein
VKRNGPSTFRFSFPDVMGDALNDEVLWRRGIIHGEREKMLRDSPNDLITLLILSGTMTLKVME